MKRCLALVIVGALSVSGCSTTAHQPDRSAGPEGGGLVRVRSGATGDAVVHVPPGPRLAEVVVAWSNGARESARWVFEVPPGATYRVVANEAGRGGGAGIA